MRAVLEFDLGNPDDVMAHYRCVESLNMASALFEIAYNLGKKCRYIAESEENNGKDMYDGVDLCFEKIHEVFEDYGIDIDKLIN